MTKNINEEISALFSNLLSPDQMVADETFDHILFSTDPKMNRTIIDVMKAFKNDDGILCECLQLLSFRCSQTNEKRLLSRPQTVKEMQYVISGLLEHLGSLRALIRLEVLIALEEVFQYSSKLEYSKKKGDLIDILNDYNLPCIFADEQLYQEVLERVEICMSEPNTLVAQRAEESLKKIERNISSARASMRAKNIEFETSTQETGTQ